MFGIFWEYTANKTKRNFDFGFWTITPITKNSEDIDRRKGCRCWAWMAGSVRSGQWLRRHGLVWRRTDGEEDAQSMADLEMTGTANLCCGGVGRWAEVEGDNDASDMVAARWGVDQIVHGWWRRRQYRAKFSWTRCGVAAVDRQWRRWSKIWDSWSAIFFLFFCLHGLMNLPLQHASGAKTSGRRRSWGQ
jgi:hypothetical protein